MTPQQHTLLTYLQTYIGEYGYAPSIREIAETLGLQSTSSAHRLLRRLEKRGHIRRLPNRARAIELVRHVCPHCGGAL